MDMSRILAYEPEEWHHDFVIVPHRTISKNWIWGSCYSRRVWISYGMGLEPEIEYGNIIDVLKS